jgi:hypothetical protein
MDTLYVTMVPDYVSIQNLLDEFEVYGPCKINKEGVFLVVKYEDHRDANDAFENRIYVKGKELCCEFTKEKALNCKLYPV